MTILAIETSHDDSSIAILENNKILKNIIFSQIDIHAKYGGTIPEIASREHVNNIALILQEIKKVIKLDKIDYIAYTKEPGLIGALQVGYLFASAISLAINKPLIAINHLDGHFFSGAIDNEILYPALGLLVSGGHTQILYAENENNIKIIGETLDDAVGEAYDKVARKLNLGFPGGPLIDKEYWNYSGKRTSIKLTKPKTEEIYDFSLSGIKTQVINIINNFENRKLNVPVSEIAYEFQKTVVEYLIEKFSLAIKHYQVNSIVLAGGVSANKLLRQEFLKLHKNVITPDLKYCTDNAAMIAKAAQIYLKNN
ncbi:tRNA (adenosine(37)-N6)-threonylcarbamoyltransferase complex transferase subunit TsaD [Mesomycoplasma lagogenitalium]|uniref:tRNA N6-adenosine threonylcarbamoyltransferase n=1 Tax=Mesomycoplasma lagogenitalium TaxID=171286 RepID=A0ABY8LWQ1_9BACT|nr:tRNA (adenosine(37)-N6)-threonylcarbamoyltransferase complex transferase subunit TsaD [Mesomycoplasma lagogenitalium]WGI36552.1 tRNA (adenosine(37)-N6)-threonylcarbamoyltransferase complex transferase subunit TsaD [Mesomycoplasma lagogenitalium]